MENNFPKKFQNEDGSLNAEALLKSYSELEKKIGAMVSVPADGDDDIEARAKFNRAVGVPESADGYPDNPMFEGAAGIKEKFFEIGLSAKQAESVLALAAEFLMPTIEGVMSANYESAAMKELSEFFGGDDKMQAALAELDNYAGKNLSPEAYEALSSSADGIKTIYNMMQSNEPVIQSNGRTADKPNDDELRQMMKDPKYWRDHDGEFIRKIESGFKKLYKN